jgi:hypothetical protein
MPRLADAVRPRLRYASPDSPPSFPLSSPGLDSVAGGRPPLPLNSVSRSGLVTLFERTSGLSELSARHIVTERDLHGPFTDNIDFTCRVPGIRHTLLRRFFDLSFVEQPVRAPANSVSRPSDLAGLCGAFEDVIVRDKACRVEDVRRIVDDVPYVVDNVRQLSRTDDDGTLITFALWNCARMSPKSPNFEKKCAVLERMVSDTPTLSVIFLQEVIACATEHVTSRLRSCTGDTGWTAVGCDGTGRGNFHAHPRTCGATCQVALYNASKVRCLADSYVASSPADSTSFKRAPHVCIFEPVVPGGLAPGKLLCIANCHILQRAPQPELELLADLVRAMRNACARAVRREGRPGLLRSGEVIYVVAGDFNRGSESSDFNRLRQEEDFVELVQSPRVSVSYAHVAAEVVDGAGESSSGVILRYLTEATTSGGLHIDNIWMNRTVRCANLIDAWQYVPGGNGRSLHETGYASAGRVRSERSDHIPIVVKLRLGTVQKNSCKGTALEYVGPCRWAVRDAFQVTLDT